VGLVDRKLIFVYEAPAEKSETMSFISSYIVFASIMQF